MTRRSRRHWLVLPILVVALSAAGCDLNPFDDTYDFELRVTGSGNFSGATTLTSAQGGVVSGTLRDRAPFSRSYRGNVLSAAVSLDSPGSITLVILRNGRERGRASTSSEGQIISVAG